MVPRLGILLVGVALGVAGAAASEKKCAQAGGRKALGKKRAQRRLPPRKERARRLARSAGIGRISRGRPAAAGGLRLPAPNREAIHCPPLPWLPARADDAILEVIGHGAAEPERVTAAALQVVYPVTEYGDEITWPARGDDCAGLRLLEERMRRRVELRLAELRDREVDEAYQ